MNSQNKYLIQLHCGNNTIKKVYIKNPNDIDYIRPKSVLWTSTYNPDYGGHWYQSREREFSQWLYNISIREYDKEPLYLKYYLIYLKESTRILHLDNIEDIENFCMKYGNNYEFYKLGHKKIPFKLTSANLTQEKLEIIRKRNENLSRFRINYKILTNHYDAVHLSYNGLNQCNKYINMFKNWDSESMFIFNKEIIKDIQKINFNVKWNQLFKIDLYKPFIKKWLPLLDAKIFKIVNEKMDSSIGTDNDPIIYNLIDEFNDENPSFQEYWYNLFILDDNQSIRRYILMKIIEIRNVNRKK